MDAPPRVRVSTYQAMRLRQLVATAPPDDLLHVQEQQGGVLFAATPTTEASHEPTGSTDGPVGLLSKRLRRRW